MTSTFGAVAAAWMAELVANVSALSAAIQHTDYAPFSVELLSAQAGERHIAVSVNGDPEVASGLVAGTPPADLVATSYTITIWEEAPTVTRLQDDDAASEVWLQLYEDVRARLYVQTNRTLGDANNGWVRYQGGTMETVAGLRVLQVRFSTARVLSYT